MIALARRLPPLPMFLVASLAVYTAELLVVRTSTFAAHPATVGPAVAFDVAIFVPALYWLLVMRRGAGSWLGFFAVLTVAWLLAPLMLPPAQRHYLAALLFLAPAAEAVSLGYAASRVRRVARAYRAWPGDPRDALARMRHAVCVGLGDSAAWRALADELSMWRYAVAPLTVGEATQPSKDRDAARRPNASFTYHRRSAWPAIVFAIAVAGVAETLGLHLLVALWSSRAAWLLSFSSVYAVLWLVADVRACARRPLLLEAEALLVRLGIRWTVRVPYARIAGVETVRGTGVPPRRAAGYLRAVPFGAPSVLLRLSDDVLAEGPYGIRRRVRLIGLAPDDAAAFVATLTRRTRAS